MNTDWVDNSQLIEASIEWQSVTEWESRYAELVGEPLPARLRDRLEDEGER